MPREFETTIRFGGVMDSSLRRSINNIVDQIDQIEAAARQAASAYDNLSDEIKNQGDALKKAKKEYAAYVLKGEQSSDQAKELAKRIQTLSGELKDNQLKLRGAENAADRLTGSLDDVGDAARGAGDGFTIMKGVVANLVSSGIQNLIGMCSNAVTSIYDLADSTREFRQDMGTLETAFDSADFTARQANKTWLDLYSIFGEDDRAVEAANNIARIADSQYDLDKWTKITTGIWGTYQDALPVESLAESAAETINVGEVTGSLADALNWSSEAAKMFAGYMSDDVTTAEDAFNVALSKCTTEAERNALITDTLTALYGDAADKYKQTASSVIEANEANGKFLQTQAKLGERIEPITTAVKNGYNGILEKVLELVSGVDVGSYADMVADGFETALNVMDKIPDAIDWIIKNGSKLIPIVGGLTAAFASYKAISAAVAVAEAVKTAVIASGATAVTASTVATWALNSALAVLTSPITLVVAAIAALTAGVIWLYQNWDTAKEKLIQFGAKVNEIWTGISGWITNAIDIIGAYFPVFGGYLSGWWSSIQDAINNVKNIFSGLIDFISNVFAGNWSAAWQNIVNIFGNIFGMILNFAKAPLNGVIGAINAVINGINSISVTVPDWVPGFGGNTFGFSIPNIPTFAAGGFTNGVSIAGEAGTEAVISFNPAYREQNLSYWAKAGRLLGATVDDADFSASMSSSAKAGRLLSATVNDAGFSLSGDTGGGTTVVDMGGITFAPQITVSGSDDKTSVVKAIEDEYPEFLDVLERWLWERGLPVNG